MERHAFAPPQQLGQHVVSLVGRCTDTHCIYIQRLAAMLVSIAVQSLIARMEVCLMLLLYNVTVVLASVDQLVVSFQQSETLVRTACRETVMVFSPSKFTVCENGALYNSTSRQCVCMPGSSGPLCGKCRVAESLSMLIHSD